MGFIVSNDLIESKVDYIELGKNEVLVIGKDQYGEICKKKGIKVKTLLAKFSRPSWGKFNLYVRGTVKDDLSTGESHMDTVLLRQQKFRYLLEEIYEVIDEELKPITLTEHLFENINADLALALVNGFDRSLISEREEAANILGIFNFDEEETKQEESEEEEKVEELEKIE